MPRDEWMVEYVGGGSSGQKYRRESTMTPFPSPTLATGPGLKELESPHKLNCPTSAWTNTISLKFVKSIFSQEHNRTFCHYTIPLIFIFIIECRWRMHIFDSKDRTEKFSEWKYLKTRLESMKWQSKQYYINHKSLKLQ